MTTYASTRRRPSGAGSALASGPIARFTLTGTAALAALALAACGGSTSHAATSNATTASKAAPSIAAPASWTGTFVFVEKPSLLGKMLVGAVSPSESVNEMAAVDTATGKTLWKTALPLPASGRVWRDAEKALIKTTGGYTSDGTPVAVAQYGFDAPGSGLTGGSSGWTAVGFDATTGKVLWQREVADVLLPTADVAKPGAPAPVVFGNKGSGAVGDHPKAEGIDLATGKTLWTYDGKNILEWVTGSTVIGSTPNNGLVGFDAFTGQQRWATPEVKSVGWYVSQAVGGGVLVDKTTPIGSTYFEKSQAILLDAATGQVRKEFDHPLKNEGGTNTLALLDDDGSSVYLLNEGESLQGIVGGSAWKLNISAGGQLLAARGGLLWVEGASTVVLDAKEGKEIGPAKMPATFVLPDRLIFANGMLLSDPRPK